MEKKPEQQADCLATYAQPERHLMANTAIDFWRPENVGENVRENLWKFTANEPPYTDELLNVLDLFKSNVIQSGKCWLTPHQMEWNGVRFGQEQWGVWAWQIDHPAAEIGKRTNSFRVQ